MNRCLSGGGAVVLDAGGGESLEPEQPKIDAAQNSAQSREYRTLVRPDEWVNR